MDVKTVAQLRKYLARPPKSLTEYVQGRITSFDKSGKKKVKAKKKKEVAAEILAAPVLATAPVVEDIAPETDLEFSGVILDDGTIEIDPEV